MKVDLAKQATALGLHSALHAIPPAGVNRQHSAVHEAGEGGLRCLEHIPRADAVVNTHVVKCYSPEHPRG